MSDRQRNLLASRCGVNRDVESMWFFIRYVGTRFDKRPLPCLACSLVVRFLGTDEYGQTPGELSVCSQLLFELEWLQLQPGRERNLDEDILKASSSEWPSTSYAGSLTASVSETMSIAPTDDDSTNA
eukprot:TRINITY_DN21046_c0_g1_i1.p1 TRINITY_DN21046_c0_g1~~TRINITY_DN21046_c0_g1_i1.p1  ORF type:complete len:144 (+),score=15.70 TRINITY_DN21046_c0_g1_i1:53-433(+)